MGTMVLDDQETVATDNVLEYLDVVEGLAVSKLKDISAVKLVSAAEVQDMLLDMLNASTEFRKKVGLYVE
jgi:hypothetical protein